MQRIAVIGAGPAGLSAAYQLAKAGVEVEVFEASHAVGGRARSLCLWGQTVDLGPQPFDTSDARVRRLWLEIVGRDFNLLERRTRTLDCGRWLAQPPSARDCLRADTGWFESARCLAGYLKRQVRRGTNQLDNASEDCAAELLTPRFGRAYVDRFIEPLCQKRWGLTTEQLDIDAGRVLLAERSPPKSFAYPKAGSGLVYDRLTDYLRGLGCTVRLNCPVRGVVQQAGRVRGLTTAAGDFLPFDRVLSTMPLPELVRRIDEAPFDVQRAALALKFRETLLIFLRVAGRELFPDQVLQILDPSLLVHRVTNFANWLPQKSSAEETILCLEYACGEQDELWSQSDADLLPRATAEMTTMGLLAGGPARRASVTGGMVVRRARSIPVATRGYRQHVQRLTHFLDPIAGLTTLGSQGSFRQLTPAQSLLMGMLAAENLLENKQHNLWRLPAETPDREALNLSAQELAQSAG